MWSLKWNLIWGLTKVDFFSDDSDENLKKRNKIGLQNSLSCHNLNLYCRFECFYLHSTSSWLFRLAYLFPLSFVQVMRGIAEICPWKYRFSWAEVLETPLYRPTRYVINSDLVCIGLPCERFGNHFPGIILIPSEALTQCGYGVSDFSRITSEEALYRALHNGLNKTNTNMTKINIYKNRPNISN